MKAVFFSRSFAAVNAGFCSYEVQKMSWKDEGGCAAASIRAIGSMAALSNLVGFLRYGVVVSDENGPAWWGFVNAVEIHAAGVVYQVSLDGLANRVAVRYRAENPLSGDSLSWQYQSAWVDDLNSQSLYGVKEEIYNLGESRADQAAAAAATYLARLKQPATSSQPAEQEETSYAVLLCLGWWETLNWKFYTQTRGYSGNVESAAGGVSQPWGDNVVRSRFEQRFTAGGSGAAWTVRYIWLKMYRVGAPADNVTLDLLTGPTSGGIAAATVAGSTLSKDSASWYVFDLGAGASLTPGTDYYIRVLRSGAVDAANYYGVKVEEDSLLGVNYFTLFNSPNYIARVPSASAITAVLGVGSVTSQITAMGTAAQFITGVLIKTASTIQGRLYRSGKLRIMEELHDLARTGFSSGAGSRLWVDVSRVLVCEPRPGSDRIELRINAAGEVRHFTGRRLLGSESPVGKWALVEGLAIIGGTVGAPGVVYVDRAEWEDGKMFVKWE